MSISNFLQGYTNYILHQLSLLDEKKKKVAQERIAICKTCPHLRKRPRTQRLECGACHCDWPALTFAMKKPCKMKKFPAVDI